MTIGMNSGTTSSFSNTMRAAGIEPPQEIIADGRLHRFHIKGDRPGSKNGWYILYTNLAAGAFGCWKRGVSETWSARNPSEMSAEDRETYRAKLDEMKRQREEEQEHIHAECRARCAKIWNEAPDATDEHSYLIKKGVRSYGLKLFEGSLLVSVQDTEGVNENEALFSRV
jgi:putative DNA primase/helicase